MADAIVYVDGFNLYYGSLKRTPYKRLDLGRLCTRMLPVVPACFLAAPETRLARRLIGQGL